MSFSFFFFGSLISGGIRVSQIPSAPPFVRRCALLSSPLVFVSRPFPLSWEPFGLSAAILGEPSTTRKGNGADNKEDVYGTSGGGEEQRRMARFASTGCGNGFWGDKEDERGEAEPDNNSLRDAAAVQSSRCEVKGQASVQSNRLTTVT